MSSQIEVLIANYPIIGKADKELVDHIQKNRRYSIDDLQFISVENAHFAGTHLICIRDGQVVPESFRGEKGIKRSPFLIRDGGLVRWDTQAVTTLHQENAVVVGGKASGEFFHWLVEIVPRLVMIRERFSSDQCTLIMRPITKRFQHESIAALGLQPLYATEDVIAVEHGIFPTHTISFRGLGWITPEIVPWARLFADKYLGIKGGAPRSRIYISRADAPKRKVENEAQVIELLAQHGFVPVQLSSLSLRDQIELFVNAEAVVGLHGAGLTSIMFGQPGAKVIEFYPQRFNVVSPFWNLASLKEMQYRMVMCQPLTTADSTHDADVHVSIIRLSQALIQLELI